jgi:hypothetical protein
MDGTNVTFAGAVGPFNPGLSWQIKGTGDFNGDGKSDIIWQGQDGTPAIWLMDGTTVTGVGAVGSNFGASWHVVGTSSTTAKLKPTSFGSTTAARLRCGLWTGWT